MPACHTPTAKNLFCAYTIKHRSQWTWKLKSNLFFTICMCVNVCVSFPSHEIIIKKKKDRKKKEARRTYPWPKLELNSVSGQSSPKQHVWSLRRPTACSVLCRLLCRLHSQRTVPGLRWNQAKTTSLKRSRFCSTSEHDCYDHIWPNEPISDVNASLFRNNWSNRSGCESTLSDFVYPPWLNMHLTLNYPDVANPSHLLPLHLLTLEFSNVICPSTARFLFNGFLTFLSRVLQASRCSKQSCHPPLLTFIIRSPHSSAHSYCPI